MRAEVADLLFAQQTGHGLRDLRAQRITDLLRRSSTSFRGTLVMRGPNRSRLGGMARVPPLGGPAVPLWDKKVLRRWRDPCGTFGTRVSTVRPCTCQGSRRAVAASLAFRIAHAAAATVALNHRWYASADAEGPPAKPGAWPPADLRAVDGLPLLGQQRGAIECGAGQGHRARRRPSSAARAAGHRAPAAGLGHQVLDAADLDVGRR